MKLIKKFIDKRIIQITKETEQLMKETEWTTKKSFEEEKTKDIFGAYEDQQANKFKQMVLKIEFEKRKEMVLQYKELKGFIERTNIIPTVEKKPEEKVDKPKRKYHRQKELATDVIE